MQKKIYLYLRYTVIVFAVIGSSYTYGEIIDFSIRGGVVTKNLTDSGSWKDIQALSGFHVGSELDILFLPINFTIDYYDVFAKDNSATIQEQEIKQELHVKETHFGINKGVSITDLFRPYLGLGVITGHATYTKKPKGAGNKTQISSDTSGYYGSLGARIELVNIQFGIDYRKTLINTPKKFDNVGKLHSTQATFFLGYVW